MWCVESESEICTVDKGKPEGIIVLLGKVYTDFNHQLKKLGMDFGANIGYNHMEKIHKFMVHFAIFTINKFNKLVSSVC